jgi:hypothetical protein
MGAGVAVAALAVGIAGCGDDADTAATTTTKATPKTVEVTAVDYRYEDLPDSIDAGAKLTLRNASTDELHEMVVLKIPASEHRSVDEIVKLPESELDALFAGEPAAVILAPPGGDAIEAVGDGTIAEPGRYVVVCTIPQGADPQAYLNAPEGDGPPQVEGGPPHFTLGMYRQLTVE